MTGIAVVGGVLTVVLSVWSIFITLRNQYRNKDAKLPNLLNELRTKKAEGRDITEGDIARVMESISVKDYADSPEERRLFVTELIDAAATTHRSKAGPRTTVYVNTPPTQTTTERTTAQP